MPDLFLISIISGSLLFLIIFWVYYIQQRSKKSLTNVNVVINHSIPEKPKFWSGSSISKNFDDTGDLDINSDGLTFRGQKSNFEITRDSIQDIKSIRSKSPWTFVIAVNLLAAGALVYSYLYNPPLIIVILMCLVVLDGMVLVMGTGIEWIEIYYKKNEKLTNLYIGQGAGNIINRLFPQNRGVFGGNYDLYKQMQNILIDRAK